MSMKLTDTVATHIVAVWHAMYEESTVEEDYRIYTGKLSKLVADLGISGTYYSPVFRALYELEFAALLDRGGRNKPSTVALLTEPTLNNLKGLTVASQAPILSLSVRLDSLEKSIGGMHIVGAFQEIEKRLEALEATRRKGKS